MKTVAIVCAVLGLVVSGALAGGNETVTVATNSGICVRAGASAIQAGSSNVLGAAVNTEGVVRATSAVKVEGRVFLVGASTPAEAQARVAVITQAMPENDPPKAPEGLGLVLARIFGFCRA